MLYYRLPCCITGCLAVLLADHQGAGANTLFSAKNTFFQSRAPPGGQMAMLVSLLYGGGGEVW